MNAKVKWVDGLQFVGESAIGHAIVMDGNIDAGGKYTGMRPTELLLLGLGGCSGMDVVSILKKKKQQITDMEINVKGQKADSYPKKFTDIEIEYIISGINISEDAVKRSIELSMEKYCSVKATLQGVSNISFTYRIIQIQ